MAGTSFPGGVGLGDGQQISALPGVPAQGLLRFSGNVVHAETITVGSVVLRLSNLATDSTKDTANGEFNNVNDHIEVTIPAHGMSVGDVFLVESEVFRVERVRGANRLIVKRGVSGTTKAAHANGQNIMVAASAPGAGIQVGLAGTLTPTAAIPRIVADFNAIAGTGVKMAGVENAAIILYTVDKDGNPEGRTDTRATTETLTNGAWVAANMAGGISSYTEMTDRFVPTAADVTAGYIYRIYPFVPTVVDVSVRVDSSQAVVAWDGVATVSGNMVKYDNAGATDWAATSEIIATIRGG